VTDTVLITGPPGLADALAAGLRARGRTVERRPLTDPDRAAVGTEVDTAATALGGIGLAVHVHGSATAPQELEDMTTETWVAEAEDEMARAFHLVQALHPHLAASQGRLVAVVPSFAMAGAAGFAPAATSAEALRVLVKGVAKQWGSQGITANCVAVDAQLVVPGDAGRAVSEGVALAVPALGRSGEPAADLAPLLEAVTGADAHFLTGATVVADGGVWMAAP
jgi:NAD(P)-dependent dehydrogenase (short-subunit alcohol dehydrogenase family)